jgi:hypothetical protein
VNESNDWNEYVEQLIQDCADRQATVNLRSCASVRRRQRPDRHRGPADDLPRTPSSDPSSKRAGQPPSTPSHIVWEYEPETFTLPSGVRYLPDFHLTEIGVWLEVKGPGIPRIEKAYELGEMLACDCPDMACTCRWPGGEMVIVGHPPTPMDPWSDEAYSHWPSVAKSKLARRHGGFIRWTSTGRHNSWMTRCSGCARVSWVEGPRLRRCPACGGTPESRLYRDFEKHFEFVRLPWLSAANTQVEHDPAA